MEVHGVSWWMRHRPVHAIDVRAGYRDAIEDRTPQFPFYLQSSKLRAVVYFIGWIWGGQVAKYRG